MSWVSVGSAAVTAIGGIVASKNQKAPATAEYKPVDVQAEQRKVLAGNLASFDDASLLAAKTNTFNQSETQRLLEQAIPGFGQLQARLLQQVNGDLDSQTSLPKDVSDKIAQYAAEKGVAHGTSGQFNGFSLVKDFGFNLVDWQNAQRARALNTLSAVYGMAPRVNVMSPMASMVDPNTAIQAAQKSAQSQYQSDENQAAAANASAGSGGQASGPNLSSLLGAAGKVYDWMNARSVQSKVLKAPDAEGNTMTPYIVKG